MQLKKNIAKGAAVVTGLALAAPFAFADAAADPGIDAINELSSRATAYIGAAFAVAVVAAGGFWGIKMMKKAFANAK